MIKLELLVGVVFFAVWVFALVDVLGTPEHRVRTLPKIGWVAVVVIFGAVGGVVWFVMGRPEGAGGRPMSSHERSAPSFPEYDRPGRAASTDPAKDEDFLRQVRERAEKQRQQYRESKKQEQEPPAEA